MSATNEAVLTIAAAAGAEHRGDAVLAAEEDALEVHAHDQVPRLLVGLEDRAVGGREDAGVVEEDIRACRSSSRRPRPSPRRPPRCETSAWTKRALPPALSICSTASSRRVVCTSATTTRAPSRAKSSAASRPMPLPAPVISATLSSISCLHLETRNSHSQSNSSQPLSKNRSRSQLVTASSNLRCSVRRKWR